MAESQLNAMKTADRISAIIMIAIGVAVPVGLLVFSCYRDHKALTSYQQLCHPTEAVAECLEPLPELA
jgi:hypothetical protein